jgi:diacylglycerol kinase family enzyme
VRALLIINPRATSMSGGAAGRLVRELDSSLDLETAETRYRGHAYELAADAVARKTDLVVSFGGDGTVNEVVNGLMSRQPGEQVPPGEGGRPALAPIPGGGANVFARALGMPQDPSGALDRLLHLIAEDGKPADGHAPGRTIGLGLASSPTWDRYFTFSAGLGFDAEVVAEIDRRRAHGRKESTPLFVWTALHRYYTATDRRSPALTLEADGMAAAKGLFMGVVTNSSPWTYLGKRPVLPAPNSDFNSGLDVFALRRLRTLSTLAALGQMMCTRCGPLTGRDVLGATKLNDLVFEASRPIAFHIDGEYLGETEKVAFRHLSSALRVLALVM